MKLKLVAIIGAISLLAGCAANAQQQGLEATLTVSDETTTLEQPLQLQTKVTFDGTLVKDDVIVEYELLEQNVATILPATKTKPGVYALDVQPTTIGPYTITAHVTYGDYHTMPTTVVEVTAP